jgi:hypothetical protein
VAHSAACPASLMVNHSIESHHSEVRTVTHATQIQLCPTYQAEIQHQIRRPIHPHHRESQRTPIGATILMLRLLPRPPDRLEQIRLGHLLPTREIPSGDLRIDLHARVGRDEMVCTGATVNFMRRTLASIPQRKHQKHAPGRSYRFKIRIPLPTIALYFISLMLTIRSTLRIPSQCSTSGISAWKRMSFTPAISSVAAKYLSAESPPRLRRLYTRYLGDRRWVRWVGASGNGRRIERRSEEHEKRRKREELERRTEEDEENQDKIKPNHSLCHFTQRAPLLPEIHHDTNTA